MPPIRADHGLSWRKAAAGGGVEAPEERSKQPRRSTPLTKRSSPSHSRTPSPNLQVPSSSSIATVHVPAGYGHVGARRSPSSKAAGSGSSSSRNVFPESGPREKRRASPTHADPSRKGYTSHAHSQRGPPFKVAGASWGVSSPTQVVGGGGGGGSGSGRANPSPTQPSGSNKRDHSSPTLASRDPAASAAAAVDGLQQLLLPAATTAAAAAGTAMSSSSTASAMLVAGPLGGSGGGGGGGGGSGLDASRAEVREMTRLDRVFLEQPHEGRKDVEGDDLHVSNEIQRHLKTRVQSQQSQLMEATESSSSSSTTLQQQQQQPVSISNVPAVVCGGGGSSSVGTDFMDHHHGPDLLLSSTGLGVTPVSPSSGSGPVQGNKEDLDVEGLSFGNPMDFLLAGSDGGAGGGSRGGGGGGYGTLNRESSSPSRGSPRSRSPPAVLPALGPKPDIQMGEAGGGVGVGVRVGGDGNLREVVSGFDAMDLDDLGNVDLALALLTAKKQWIIANAKQQQQQQQQQAHQQHNIVPIVPPQPPPPLSSAGGGSSRAGSGSRQRRSGGRTSSSRHQGGVGEQGSPSTAGGRSEAFGVSGGGSVRGTGGAPMPSSSVTYSSNRGPRGQQGRPPPVPGHLSASTAAMRRSSPGSIASLAELDSYLEHHHRRLVEQVEGGAGTDDVEAEIRASRTPRRGTRSHQRFGASPGSHNGLGSSNSSSSVPRTVGAGVSTKSFFHSTLSADGYNSGGGGGNNGRHEQHHQYQHHHHHQRVPVEWSCNVNGNGNGERSSVSSSSQGWDPPNLRGPGYKRERAEDIRGGGEDGGWGASLRGFRGGDDNSNGGGGVDEDADSRGSAFMGVCGTSQTSSPPPSSIMSSDDVSVSSYGHPVNVLPGSPNNMRFDGRPPPSLAKIRLEAVRSPVVRHGRFGARGGRGGAEDGSGGLVFTSPDASKHVQELCSPRSAFTPRSASSLSSLASSRGRRR